MDNRPRAEREAARFASWVITLAIVAVFCVVAATATFVVATELVLILFLAVLFSVLLAHVSAWVSAHTPLSYGWSLGAVAVLLVLSMALGVAFIGVRLNTQFTVAAKHFDDGIGRLQKLADRYPSVKPVLQSTPFIRQIFDETPRNPNANADRSRSGADQGERRATGLSAEQEAVRSAARQVFAAVASVAKTTFGLVVNSLLIFFTGLFLAIAPDHYRDGVVQLFPPRRRLRTREILDQIGSTLWHWLIGRLFTMLVTGLGAGLLLAVLGVPMPLTLGLLTALLAFIPNIGGLIALGVSVLFALPQGGTTVTLLVLGYIVMQLIESYLITPLVQQRQTSLPPALLIAFQAIMGILFGFLGAAVASPLLAAAKVFVEEAYVKDVLERHGEGGM